MKLPVAYTLGNRAASLDKDALMRNALAEAGEDEGVMRARKRPAINSAFTAATGQGQGLFNWNMPGGVEFLVVITDDTVNTSPASLNTYLEFTVGP